MSAVVVLVVSGAAIAWSIYLLVGLTVEMVKDRQHDFTICIVCGGTGFSRATGEPCAVEAAGLHGDPLFSEGQG